MLPVVVFTTTSLNAIIAFSVSFFFTVRLLIMFSVPSPVPFMLIISAYCESFIPFRLNVVFVIANLSTSLISSILLAVTLVPISTLSISTVPPLIEIRCPVGTRNVSVPMSASSQAYKLIMSLITTLLITTFLASFTYARAAAIS